MKGDKLGEFEEFTLLAICAIDAGARAGGGEAAYGVPVQQFVERTTKRRVAMGAVYAALTRLEEKGFVRSALGEAQQMRGGKRRRIYTVTMQGHKAVKELRETRERIWKAIEAEGRV